MTDIGELDLQLMRSYPPTDGELWADYSGRILAMMTGEAEGRLERYYDESSKKWFIREVVQANE